MAMWIFDYLLTFFTFGFKIAYLRHVMQVSTESINIYLSIYMELTFRFWFSKFMNSSTVTLSIVSTAVITQLKKNEDFWHIQILIFG